VFPHMLLLQDLWLLTMFNTLRPDLFTNSKQVTKSQLILRGTGVGGPEKICTGK
jgi:hypothetical protein